MVDCLNGLWVDGVVFGDDHSELLVSCIILHKYFVELLEYLVLVESGVKLEPSELILYLLPDEHFIFDFRQGGLSLQYFSKPSLVLSDSNLGLRERVPPHDFLP